MSQPARCGAKGGEERGMAAAPVCRDLSCSVCCGPGVHAPAAPCPLCRQSFTPADVLSKDALDTAMLAQVSGGKEGLGRLQPLVGRVVCVVNG